MDKRSRWPLFAPIAPSAWPPRDVKSSAQTTALATVDLAPAADVVGRREIGDRAVFVVRRESGKAAHFAERSLIEQQRDAFATREFAAAALSHYAGVARIAREASIGDVLQCAHFREQRRPGVFAAEARGSNRAVRLRGGDDGNHLPHCHRVADTEALHLRYGAGARRRHRGFHLHRGNDRNRLAGSDYGTYLQRSLRAHFLPSVFPRRVDRLPPPVAEPTAHR